MRKVSAIIFASLTGIPGLALAQDAANEVDHGEIIVTAQRREQSILDVPLAISAVSGDALASRGIVNSSNLQDVIPNLQISSPYGQSQPNFSMRGISVGNEYNSNQVSPIGVYIDDVYMASRISHGMGLFDLDRVEVLRGPQGTLFGRNTTGGAINFITRAPTLSGNRGYVELGYGNYDTWRGQAALETTMVEDELGFRIAANWAKGDGQIKNIFPGQRDANSLDTLQGRAQLRMRPGQGPVDITLKVYGGRERGTQAGVHGRADARVGLGFFEVNENRIGVSSTDAYGASAKIAWELSQQLTFTSITAVDGGMQDLPVGSDGSPLDVLDLHFRTDYSQFSEEARLNFSNDKVEVVGGVFYGTDKVDVHNIRYFGDAFGPGVNGGYDQYYKQKRRSVAVFAQGDYALTDSLTLTLGARYTWDKIRYHDAWAYLFRGNVSGPFTPLFTTVPCSGNPGACAFDPNARFAVGGSDSALTGRVALSYELADGTLLYGSYNRGYRAGAVNGAGQRRSDGITYVDPETVNAYEVGVKGRYFGALTLAVAGFYYDYSDQQLGDSQAGPVNVLVNAPKSRVMGGEIEAVLRASAALTLNASVGFQDAKYKELTLQGVVLNGNRLPNAPKWSVQVGGDLQLPDIADGVLKFSPAMTYASKQFFTPFNNVNIPNTAQRNQELAQDGNVRVNAALSWEKDAVMLKAFVNNAFNTKIYTYGLDLLISGLGYNYLIPAAPRTYGASVRVSF